MMTIVTDHTSLVASVRAGHHLARKRAKRDRINRDALPCKPFARCRLSWWMPALLAEYAKVSMSGS